MPAKNVTGRRIGAAFIDLGLYVALCFGIFFLMADSTDGSVLLDSINIHLQLGEKTWYSASSRLHRLDSGQADHRPAGGSRRPRARG